MEENKTPCADECESAEVKQPEAEVVTEDTAEAETEEKACKKKQKKPWKIV